MLNDGTAGQHPAFPDTAEPRAGVASLLPSVPAEIVEAINWLSRPRAPLRFTFDGQAVDCTIALLAMPHEAAMAIALTIGGEPARLGLPAMAAERLAEAINLSSPLAVEDAPQRAILVEYALLDLIGLIEARLRRPIHVSPNDVAWGLPVELELSLGFEGGEKQAATLAMGPVLAMQLAEELERLAPSRPFDASAVPMTLCLEAGRQMLALREIVSLAPGDIVMLDETATVASLAGHPVAPIEGTGGGFRVSGKPNIPSHQRMLQKDASMDDSNGEGGLDDLPVRLVFEFGRIDMALRDLRGLAVGSLLPLARPIEDAVDIVANGRRIGRGSLVRIGDGLGVRIVRLADDAWPADR